MGKGKPHKKTTHGDKKSDSKNTAQKNVEVTDHGNQESDDNKGATAFSKRKLESNWGRYDDPDDIETSSPDEENEQSDETKDFEYIKTNAEGASSHFQFQEEKEWQQQLQEDVMKTGSKFLDLNLNQVAADLSSFGLITKLNLEKVDNECQYCIRNLRKKDNRDTEERSTEDSDLSDIAHVWSYSGIEKFKGILYGNPQNEKQKRKNFLKTKTSPKDVNKSVSVVENEITHNESHSSNPCDKHVPEKLEKFIPESLQSKTIAMLHKSTVKNLDTGDDLLDDLLNDTEDNLSTKATEESVSMHSYETPGVEAMKMDEVVKGITGETSTELSAVTNKQTQDELDLDMLLESVTIETGPVEKSGINEKEEKNEDLDDWLDSMLE